MESLFVFRASPRERQRKMTTTSCQSQTPNSRTRGEGVGWKVGKKRRGRKYFKPAHKKPWLGWQGQEVLGAEGQKGAPHPHTLQPDCPDTEAALAGSLLLDHHTLSSRKVEMRGGRKGRQRERKREDKENTTTQNPENCLSISPPAPVKRVARE